MCRSVARLLAGGGIVLVSAALVGRDLGMFGARPCRRSSTCRDCPAFDGCRLPQALAEKQPIAPPG
jgi:hypothetical protein